MKRDEEQPKEGSRLIGPFMAPYGIGVISPGPMTVGPPQPEPEEGWTLGPASDRHSAGDEEQRPPAEHADRQRS